MQRGLRNDFGLKTPALKCCLAKDLAPIALLGTEGFSASVCQ